jgi:hypothetical protein
MADIQTEAIAVLTEVDQSEASSQLKIPEKSEILTLAEIKERSSAVGTHCLH